MKRSCDTVLHRDLKITPVAQIVKYHCIKSNSFLKEQSTIFLNMWNTYRVLPFFCSSNHSLILVILLCSELNIELNRTCWYNSVFGSMMCVLVQWCTGKLRSNIIGFKEHLKKKQEKSKTQLFNNLRWGIKWAYLKNGGLSLLGV